LSSRHRNGVEEITLCAAANSGFVDGHPALPGQLRTFRSPNAVGSSSRLPAAEAALPWHPFCIFC